LAAFGERKSSALIFGERQMGRQQRQQAQFGGGQRRRPGTLEPCPLATWIGSASASRIVGFALAGAALTALGFGIGGSGWRW
jgi:hypothetical protein